MKPKPSLRMGIITKPKPSVILEYLNTITGRKFRLTAKHRTVINARIKEGYEPEDFQMVVRKMFSKWGNDPKMAEYLRPITLFGTKMDGYLNSPDVDEIEEKRAKSSAERKRDVGDKWIEESEARENGQKTISERTQNILECRGSKP